MKLLSSFSAALSLSLSMLSLSRAQDAPAADQAAERPAQRPNVKGDPNPDLSGIDPDLIVRPPEGIDYPGCFQDMVTSDRDGNGIITQQEYLGFIQEYGKRICYETDALTLEQQAAFNSLACLCRSQEGKDASCCLQGNAQLPTAGALNPMGRTEEQLFYLTTVCTVTDGTIDSECPPYILERETPPPVVIVPVDPIAAERAGDAEPAGGMSDSAKWGIIAAAILLGLLLLMLCCCCCVCVRRRAKQLVEEEEVIENRPGKEVTTDEEAQEQAAPRVMNIAPVPPTVLEEEESYEGESRERTGGHEIDEDSYEGEGRVRTGGYDEDSASEGEGHRKRGSNYKPDEEEDEQRRYSGGELPTEENDDYNVALRAIPDKEQEEDPDWDQPAYQMEEHQVKDEDSVQEFEPYIPDGGVPMEDQQSKDVVTYEKDWNREKPPEEEEHDNRKHRIQSGLGEGEVWDKLDEATNGSRSTTGAAGGDVFDWVVQSALGVLDKTEVERRNSTDAASQPVEDESTAARPDP